MLGWVRSTQIPEIRSGRPDRNDLSSDQLHRRIAGASNYAWMSRFEQLEEFDCSLIIDHFNEIYRDKTGIMKFHTVSVAKTWYPEDGYLGWHIDNNGGRLYATWAEGESFFRYQDPFTKEIVTSWDKPKQWTFRIFTFDSKNPLWHCIGAKDIRISVGYRFVKI